MSDNNSYLRHNDQVANYLVYKHLDKGEVVYIGKGLPYRPWDCHKRRTEAHRQWIEDCILDEVEFIELVATRLTDQEATKLETELINEEQPKWNKKSTESWRDHLKQINKVNMKPVVTPDGEFESINACIRYYNLSSSTVRNRIKRNTNGWKFKDE